MKKHAVHLWLALAAALFAGCSPTSRPSEPDASTAAAPPEHFAAYAPGNSRFFYAAGTTGTVTVAAGSFVTGITAHATGAGATLTITPSGPDITDAAVGAAIPIPAGGGWAIGRPVLMGQADELGTGSVLVFAGTDAYFVSFFQGGGP